MGIRCLNPGAHCGVFSLAGLLNGVFAKTFDDISLVPTFVLTPLTYLGGVFYSPDFVAAVLARAVAPEPIVYMISGFRYGFLGINDVPLVTTFGVLVVFIVAFYLICWSLIQRGRGLQLKAISSPLDLGRGVLTTITLYQQWSG